RMLVVGFASGTIPSLPANLPLLKGAALVGVFWGTFARREPQVNMQNLQQLFAWHKEGVVTPLVSQVFPLEQATEALHVLTQRKAVGKLVVAVRDYPLRHTYKKSSRNGCFFIAALYPFPCLC